MKDNKHPHHDLIVEWAKDTSKTFQWRRGCNGHYEDCVVPAWSTELEYRIKPREFIKGCWYPCCYEGREFICKFDGSELIEPINKGYQATSITWNGDSCYGLKIGKSLGEIKFGE